VSGGASTVRGVVIDHFFGDGIMRTGQGGDLIAGCYLGVDTTGAAAAGNGAVEPPKGSDPSGSLPHSPESVRFPGCLAPF
jgi:hypothetical protein